MTNLFDKYLEELRKQYGGYVVTAAYEGAQNYNKTIAEATWRASVLSEPSTISRRRVNLLNAYVTTRPVYEVTNVVGGRKEAVRGAVEEKAAVDNGVGRITEVKIRCSLVVALRKFSQPGRSLLRVQRHRTD